MAGGVSRPTSTTRRRAIAMALLVFAIAAWVSLRPGRAWAADAGPGPEFDAGVEALVTDDLDRQTPRRTMQGFLKEAREGDFRVAANYSSISTRWRRARATPRDRISRRSSAYVLERQPTLDLAKIPDEPAGAPNAKPPDMYVADTLYAGEEPVPIILKRERFADGVNRWLIADKTVALIPVVDEAYGPRPIGVPLPQSLTRPTFLGNELWQWIGVFGAAFVAYLLARMTAAVLVRTAKYFTHRTPTQVDDVLVESARRPLRTVIGAITYRLLLNPLQLTTAVVDVLEHLTYTSLVLGITWLLLRALGVSTMVLDEHAARESYDEFLGRRIRTQAMLLRRVASLTISFVAGAIVLMQFDFVRNVGVSLLASAGVLGVVVGFAAQKSLAGIIGGIQFSVAQPVRMGDDVVVEGHYGEIEEINLTFVVVRLWDRRRLVVPITYFLEKPFQNWTRTASDLVGAVLLKVDFDVPIDADRAELRRICEADLLWDKKTCAIQASDSDATTVTLRALVSAEDGARLWDLRCRVREQLLAFIHAQVQARTAAPH